MVIILLILAAAIAMAILSFVGGFLIAILVTIGGALRVAMKYIAEVIGLTRLLLFLRSLSACAIAIMFRRRQHNDDDENAALPPGYSSIATCIANGQIGLKVVGAGLSSVSLEMHRPEGLAPLFMGVPIGTTFHSPDPSVQRMVCTATSLWIWAHTPVARVSVPAACLEMHKSTPTAHHLFSLQSPDDDYVLPSDLKTLLRASGALAVANWSHRIRQFAVWTITDNPGDRSYYRGIGPTTRMSSSPTGLPTRTELLSIKILFKALRIDIAKYRVLN